MSKSERRKHTLRVEIEREGDGRYLADLVDHPGCMAYGKTEGRAVMAAIRLLEDRLDATAWSPELDDLDEHTRNCSCRGAVMARHRAGIGEWEYESFCSCKRCSEEARKAVDVDVLAGE